MIPREKEVATDAVSSWLYSHKYKHGLRPTHGPEYVSDPSKRSRHASATELRYLKEAVDIMDVPGYVWLGGSRYLAERPAPTYS